MTSASSTFDPGVVWTVSQLKTAGVILANVSRRHLEFATHSDEMAKAISARDRLLSAMVDDNKVTVASILRGLTRLQMDKEILRVTGLAHIIADKSFH